MHSDQSEKSMFFQQMDICCQKIAESIGDKPISEWTNGDYIRLSGLLLRKTKVYISESTLKRIFGKSKTSIRYHPQKATRDALAQFIGYGDWYEFDFRHNESHTPEGLHTPVFQEDAMVTKKSKAFQAWLITVAFLGLAFMVALFLFNILGSDPADVKDAELICLNSEGISPHSAFFKIDIKHGPPKSRAEFSVNFGDGRKNVHFIDSIVSHYYEIPGRYYPTLYHKSTVIDTSVVYLQTNGWTATGYNEHDTTRVYPVQIRRTNTQALVKVSSHDAFSAGIDTSRTFFITFADIRPTTISGDDLSLSMKVVSSAVRAGVRCSQADITIYGERDRHKIGLIKPECVFWTSYKFSEKYEDGKKNDLRFLGHDLRKGADLRLLIKDKQVRLFINNQVILNTGYLKSIGKVMGISVTFSGLGKFEDMQLSDLNTKEKL